MAEHCNDGLVAHFGEDLLTKFPGEDAASIVAALAELKHAGLVELTQLVDRRQSVTLLAPCASD